MEAAPFERKWGAAPSADIDRPDQVKNLLIKIEYLGTHYKGWQIQPNVVTVEGTLKNVFEQICQQEISIKASSRTDSGVHARGQVATVMVPEKLGLNRLFLGLNALLPGDVVISDMVQVSEDFSARRNNSGKRYIYNIRNTPIPSAFDNDTFLWKKSPLNLEEMSKAISSFVGSHDFSAFRGKGCQQPTTTKTIQKAEVHPSLNNGHQQISFVFEGTGFLKNMVRIMVGTILEIGESRIGKERIIEALETGDREKAGLTAPAHGLMLDQIFYDPDPFKSRGLDSWEKRLS